MDDLIEVGGRLYSPDDFSGAEKLCLLKDYLVSIAPRGVTKQEIMQRYRISDATFYRYMRKLERLGVPIVLRISYEYAVTRIDS